MIKKYCFFVFILILLISPLYSQFSGGGNGTEQNPWGIKTLEDLYKVSDYEGHFKLLNAITDSVRYPIKQLKNSTFDGQGFTICLAIDVIDSVSDLGYYVGVGTLFRQVGGDVIIKNVIVSGYVKGGSASGILSVHKNANFKILNCINMADITAIHRAGGIIINTNTGVIENCINMGNIESIEGAAGGIVAYSNGPGPTYALLIKNCINAGYIKAGKGRYIPSKSAGIVGDACHCHEHHHIIENCINIGIVECEEIKNAISNE